MNKSLNSELSFGLQALFNDFSKHEVHGEGVGFEHEELLKLLQILKLMQSLALNMERELGVFRLTEAARFGRACVHILATEQLNELVADPSGKIVRPDFGGRS